MLALGFAGAFRPSEMVALTVADLVDGPDGYRVTIRQSKIDQEGTGQEIAIPRAGASAGAWIIDMPPTRRSQTNAIA